MNEEINNTMEAAGVGGTLIKGAFGVLGVAQGVIINNLKDVNVVLQTVSLTLGIVVALAAVVSIVRKTK